MSGKLLTLVAAIALAIGLADAAVRPRPRKRPPKAKVRDNIQRHRIGSGIKDGSLTKKEAGRLIHEQKKIKSMAKDITSDGQVTGKEKAILDRAQDKANAHIAKERHDAEGEMGPKPSDAPRHWKTWDPGVNQRQRNQHHRIAQGIHSGALTPEETRKLISMESGIRKMEQGMKSDGVLTKDERVTLHDALKDASQAIFALKHNQGHKWRVRPAIARRIDEGDLTEEEAHELLAQVRRLSQLTRLLATAPLSAEKRAELQAEYADLASQLFE